ncbi:MAG: sterol desaturase family protein [Cyanobacteriota bacterium]
MLPDVVKGFFLLLFILVPLEKIFFLHKQKIFRKGWGTDAIHYFIGYFVGRTAVLAVSGILIGHFLRSLINSEIQMKVASQPVWLQFLEAILIADTGYYIAHKLTHKIPCLWKFHAIHHSVEDMDWLATVRLHPIDQIFTKTFQIVPLYILGFTKETFTIFFLFGAFEAFFIHANIKIRFGWLRWVIATPEFHHWHHTADRKLYDKNFAAQLPILDLVFGTLYMPAGKMPEKYGISDPVPSGYLGQILYPFFKRKKVMNPVRKIGNI